jgi:hypothetical protein
VAMSAVPRSMFRREEKSFEGRADGLIPLRQRPTRAQWIWSGYVSKVLDELKPQFVRHGMELWAMPSVKIELSEQVVSLGADEKPFWPASTSSAGFHSL